MVRRRASRRCAEARRPVAPTEGRVSPLGLRSLDLQSPDLPHILVDVGMNPFRQHHRSAADYVMVAAAVVACVVLVLWAFFG